MLMHYNSIKRLKNLREVAGQQLQWIFYHLLLYLNGKMYLKQILQNKSKVPCVTNGTVYTYLAQQTTQADGQSTFRPLAQGYCMCIGQSTMSVIVQHPINRHVQPIMKLSMKPETQLSCMANAPAMWHAISKCTMWNL